MFDSSVLNLKKKKYIWPNHRLSGRQINLICRVINGENESRLLCETSDDKHEALHLKALH